MVFFTTETLRALGFTETFFLCVQKVSQEIANECASCQMRNESTGADAQGNLLTAEPQGTRRCCDRHGIDRVYRCRVCTD